MANHPCSFSIFEDNESTACGSSSDSPEYSFGAEDKDENTDGIPVSGKSTSAICLSSVGSNRGTVRGETRKISQHPCHHMMPVMP